MTHKVLLKEYLFDPLTNQPSFSEWTENDSGINWVSRGLVLDNIGETRFTSNAVRPEQLPEAIRPRDSSKELILY